MRLVAYLALFEALAGRLHRAERLAREAAATRVSDAGAGVGSAEWSCPVEAVARAWVHLGRYELEEAREWADHALDRDPGSADARYVAALAAVVHSSLLRVRHEYGKAAAVLAPHLGDAGLPRWLREEVVAEAVHTRVARGAVAEGHAVAEGIALLDATDDGTDRDAGLRATAVLPDSLAAAPVAPEALESRDVSPVVAVRNAIARAGRQLRAGAVLPAVGELSRALDRAAPETLRWPFLDAPLPARRLLRTHPELRGHVEWLSLSSPAARPRDTAGAAARREQPAPLVQDLSEREREVLVHLAAMLSTTEIAATLFISVNTVRTHIRSILRKLAATRRNQAVRRARELGII
jgi:LuxR family maltose regulon positive regulatory protein